MFVSLFGLLLAGSAHAADCDSRALIDQVKNASPVAVPAAYTKLAACDERNAKRYAGAAFGRILAGRDGHEAAIAAIDVGAGAEVRAWVDGLEPDQRSRAIKAFGKACGGSEPVQQWFVTAHGEVGEVFWSDRWYRGLADCRVEGIQAILEQAVDDEALQKDRTSYFSVLEVYARNLRAKAVPTLKAQAEANDDPEELTYLVNAFADAANVGGLDGLDAEGAAAATEAIVALAPTLPGRVVDGARQTLIAMERTAEADALAKHKWPERYADGAYTYAVTLLEEATCKNGKQRATLHTATVTEPGDKWPEDLRPKVEQTLPTVWTLEVAKKCKGEQTLTVDFPSEPLADGAARDAWLAERVEAFEARGKAYQKAKVEEHGTLELSFRSK